MIGVSYGEPTEFNYNGVINEDQINWNPKSLRRSINQDDLYVQMSFMMTMDKYGIDGPVEKFGEAFANAGYMLWHANRGARMNIWNGIMPPASGHPDHNLHADDIDFQIEADYIGLMCPAMPQTSNEICDKIGHIMNYGDGVYGGMFVSALYAAAYFEDDVKEVLMRYEEIAKRYNKLIGVHVIQPDYKLVLDKIDLGYNFIAFSLDTLFLGHIARNQMNQLKTEKKIYKE